MQERAGAQKFAWLANTSGRLRRTLYYCSNAGYTPYGGGFSRKIYAALPEQQRDINQAK